MVPWSLDTHYGLMEPWRVYRPVVATSNKKHTSGVYALMKKLLYQRIKKKQHESFIEQQNIRQLIIGLNCLAILKQDTTWKNFIYSNRKGVRHKDADFSSVTDPHQIDADPDPDPACHFDADPDPALSL